MFVRKMFASENAQLDMFVAFIRSKHLIGALQKANWDRFAFGHNGAGYKADNYDGKIAAHYKKLTSTLVAKK
jgi:hypothetical protein